MTDRLLAARATPMHEVLSVLAEDEQEQLAELLAKVLAGVYEHVGKARYVSRMCDRAACQGQEPCPFGEAERQENRDRQRMRRSDREERDDG